MSKILFYGVEEGQKQFVKDQIPEAEFVESILDDQHLPANNDAEIISVFVDSSLTDDVIKYFPNLKLITTRSTGYDHIDLASAKAKNVAVAYVPSYGEETVAEYAFALILSLSRKIFLAHDRIQEDGDFSFEGLRGFDLKDKTLGVVGTGHIGRNVIRIAKGFGMKVVASDPYPDDAFAKEAGFDYLDFEKLLSVSDIVTFHVPYMDATHHMLNTHNIAKLKNGAYVINTSRGGVIETEALIGALQSGQVAGAGLDVLEEEGIIKDELNFLANGRVDGVNMKTVLEDHVLMKMPNVLVTPHNAFNTIEALQRILKTSLDNIKSFQEGKPQNLVKE